jgi:hypothetical protein
MALSDHDLTARKKGPTCSVGILISRIDEADQVTLAEWFEDADKYSTDIALALNAEYDVSISAFTLQRHRRGACRCAA